MSAHSHIGASSMYRWSKCPGSVRLSTGITSVASSYAEEGTKAHEVAAHFLIHGEYPKDADVETVQAVSVYINAIFEDERSVYLKSSAQRLVEHKFDLSKIYPGLFGTADCVMYHPALKLLRVYDYKHGAGIAVEVKDNPQLKYYGLGALLTTGFLVDELELIIVQPRCPHPDGPVRRFKISAIDMLDFAHDLETYARRTEDPNAPLVAGDHCRFCPAAAIACPKIKEKAQALAAQEFRSDLSYDPQKLAELLYWLPVLEAWTKNVREFAHGEATHGRVPPGWKLVEKRATRKWAAGVDQGALELEFGLSADETIETKLKSPAQIEKLLSKNDKPRLNDLVVCESSGSTLVPESDKRLPIKADPKSEFIPIM